MSAKSNVTRLAPVPLVAPSVAIARLVRELDGRWEVAVGEARLVLETPDYVDPALLHEAAERGAPVLLEVASDTEPPRIVGVVQTTRTPTIDRDGDLVADVRRVVLNAREELLLKTSRTYLRIEREDIELFGRNVLTRARKAARIFARMIDLN